MLGIVVSQNRVLAKPGLQRLQYRLDPGNDFVRVDQVSGDDDQVGPPFGARFHHALEEGAAEAGCDVQIAELDDR